MALRMVPCLHSKHRINHPWRRCHFVSGIYILPSCWMWEKQVSLSRLMLAGRGSDRWEWCQKFLDMGWMVGYRQTTGFGRLLSFSRTLALLKIVRTGAIFFRWLFWPNSPFKTCSFISIWTSISLPFLKKTLPWVCIKILLVKLNAKCWCSCERKKCKDVMKHWIRQLLSVLRSLRGSTDFSGFFFLIRILTFSAYRFLKFLFKLLIDVSFISDLPYLMSYSFPLRGYLVILGHPSVAGIVFDSASYLHSVFV